MSHITLSLNFNRYLYKIRTLKTTITLSQLTCAQFLNVKCPDKFLPLPYKFLLQLVCSDQNTRYYWLQVWRKRNAHTYQPWNEREGGFCYRVMCGSRNTHRAIRANRDVQRISLNSSNVLVILFNKPMPALQNHPQKLFKEQHAL